MGVALAPPLVACRPRPVAGLLVATALLLFCSSFASPLLLLGVAVAEERTILGKDKDKYTEAELPPDLAAAQATRERMHFQVSPLVVDVWASPEKGLLTAPRALPLKGEGARGRQEGGHGAGQGGRGRHRQAGKSVLAHRRRR